MKVKEGDRLKVINHPYIPNNTIITVKYVAGDDKSVSCVVPEGKYDGYNIFLRELRELTKLERVLK